MDGVLWCPSASLDAETLALPFLIPLHWQFPIVNSFILHPDGLAVN